MKKQLKENPKSITGEELDYYPEYIEKVIEFKIPPGQKPERIDSFLARSIQNASRTKVQKGIDEGRLTVNGVVEKKANRKIQPNDLLVCRIMKSPPLELLPQDIPIEILYEDDYLLVANKPAGMCTHPGVGNRYGTLVNAIIYHLGLRNAIKLEFEDDEDDAESGVIYASADVRPGIVHRLDKDTSGLLVIAKNPEIHVLLQKQFYDRSISREYNALVWGKFAEPTGRIIGDIGRSPNDRKKFAVVKKNGKHAITDYEVLEEYEFASLVKLKLQTGRTHQIRVHMSHNGHPVFGDVTYGGDKLNVSNNNPRLKKIALDALDLSRRQLLHARVLTFRHPISKETIRIESNLPQDFLEVKEILKNGIN